MATSNKGYQKKYVLDLLQEPNMKNAKLVHTSLISKLKLSLEDTPRLDMGYYQMLVGELIYLSPDQILHLQWV